MSGVDHQRTYREQAEAYDALVAAEDRDQNLIGAIAARVPLRGATVVEVGAGTGRITRQLVAAGAWVHASDRAPAMLRVARRHLVDADAWSVVHADARSLPYRGGVADLGIAGWVFGHFRGWMPDSWRDEVGAAIAELRRCVRPDGTILIVETLGTGRVDPAPPNEALAEYYTWLEQTHAFARTALRTDYEFPTVDAAATATGAFFGEAFAARVRTEGWTRVPECTGLWARVNAEGVTKLRP